ncbi:MAG: EAL domain-containing protein [Pseudomonadota bacterium]
MTATPLRALIVENSEDDTLLLVRELRRGGYAPVYERVDTRAAMQAALAREWDIILADYNMPYFSVPAALEVLKESGRDLPFIIVSGNIGEEAAVAAMRAGVSDYIMKDNLARLAPVIERELREAAGRRRRKSAEELSARLGTILDNSPVEIYIFHADTQRLLHVNQTALRNLGYAMDELTCMKPSDFCSGLSVERFGEMVEPLCGNEHDQALFETQHRRKDGSLYPVEVRLQCSQFESAPVYVAIAQDITERKRGEERLFQEKERAQVTLHSIGDAVITTDADGIIDYLNPMAEQLTGWSNAEAQGLPLLEVFNVIHETVRIPLENPVERCLREKRIIALSEHTALIRRDGAEFSIEDSAAPIHDRNGNIIGAVLVFHDVSQARVMAYQLAYQARHDDLTGLVNRREFETCLERALEDARKKGVHHAMCYIDLDQFKVVNDTCGHIAGDKLLKELSARFQAEMRENDILARLGGDEFGVLLEGCPLNTAWRIADSLRVAAKEFRFIWRGKSFEIGASIGVVPITAESGSVADILSDADSACYVAKDKGRNRVHLYQADDTALAQHKVEMQWLSRIHRALDENRLCLYYQPMLPLGPDGGAQGAHYEILLRMRDRKGQLVVPMAFIPAAERYNLMPAIDRWVVRSVFAALHEQAERDLSPATCAINLSGQSLCDDHFLDFVFDQLEHYNIKPTQICFEITETAAISNLAPAIRFISTLKNMGCRFALDDFGSGLSSFAYLKNLPVDYLKIDGAFIKGIVNNPIDHALVESINQIGHVMQIQTIAEFVEDEAILEVVRKLGIDFGQGFGVARPQPLETFPIQ